MSNPSSFQSKFRRPPCPPPPSLFKKKLMQNPNIKPEDEPYDPNDYGDEDMKLLCYICQENLFEGTADKVAEEEVKKNIFGHAYGPNENPFAKKKDKDSPLLPKPEQNPIYLQPFALKCGHIFHKGCVKKYLLSKPCGSYSTVGKCPICSRNFCLSRCMAIKLKGRRDKPTPKEKEEIAAIEKNIDNLKTEEQNLSTKMEKYNQKINESQREIVKEGVAILKNIRKLRHVRRDNEEYKKFALDPYEEELENLNQENYMWNMILGGTISKEERLINIDVGKITDELEPSQLPPTPMGKKYSLISEHKMTTQGVRPSQEYFNQVRTPLGPTGDPRPKRSDAEIDYTPYWENIKIDDNLPEEANDPDLLPNGLYNESPCRDSDDEYDFAKIVEQFRTKVKDQVENSKAEKKDPNTESFETKVEFPKDGNDESADKDIASDYAWEELSQCASASFLNGEAFDEMAMRKFKEMLGITVKFEFKVENSLFEYEKELKESTCNINISDIEDDSDNPICANAEDDPALFLP